MITQPVFLVLQISLNKLYKPLFVHLVWVLDIPIEGRFQADFERKCVFHPFAHARHVKPIFVIVEAEILPLIDILVYGTEASLLARCLITEGDPISNGNRVSVSHVENSLLRRLFKQDVNETAQIMNMEKL